MEINQVYNAPSIPKLNRRNIKSALTSGAIKPGVQLKKTKFSFIKPIIKLIADSLVLIKKEEDQGNLVKNIDPKVELKKTKFSFIKPLIKLIPDSLVPIKKEENKDSLVKNIQSGVGLQKLLEQSNKILSQIKDQLSLVPIKKEENKDSLVPIKKEENKDSLVPIKKEENKDSLVKKEKNKDSLVKKEESKDSLVKNIQSGVGLQKLLEQSNKILSQIKEQLSLDFLSRINQEKKQLAENKKRIAAEKVKDKEKKIESGGQGLLGKTLSAVVAPAKSIFQKLLDFFSIILTGILVNTAFKWLQKPENQKKLQDFFNFLKEYWQELLIVFGAVKLLGLVRKIWKVANSIKGLIDFFKKKPQLPCNCPKSPAQQGGLPDCAPVKDCVDSLIKDPKKGPGFLESLAQGLLKTAAFAPFLLLLRKKPAQTLQPKQQQQQQVPTTPVPLQISPKSPPPPPPSPPSPPTQQPVQAPSSVPANKRVPFTRKPAATPTSVAFRSGVPMGAKSGLFSIFAQFGLGQLEQKRVSDKVSKLQQLKTSNPQEYKKQINQIRIDAKNQKYLNVFNEIIGSPGIPNAYILKALGELKQDEIPKSLENIGYNPDKLTPDLNKDGSPLSNQSLNQPTNKKVLQKQVEKIVKEKRPNLNPQQVLQVTSKAIQIIKTGVEVGRAVLIALGSSPITERSKGGTIPGLAGGGTVGGPGRMGVDSISAMISSGAKTMMGGANALLAPGEEVIRTSSSMLFRPLLKDINDNAGRLWQAFTNAVKKQNLNETIVTDLIGQFGKIIEEFKDLLDKESSQLRQRGRAPSGRGGGLLSPSSGGSVVKKIDQGVGGLVQDVGGMIGRNRGKQTGLPGGGFIGEQLGRRGANDRYQDFTNSIRSLLDRSRSNISTPNINIQNPVNLTQNVVNPQIEKTILGEKNIYVIPVPISRESSKLSSSRSSGGNVSVINLPPKVVNLTKPSQPKSLPSSPSGTSLPSISPIDESNDYIFTTPYIYGILV